MTAVEWLFEQVWINPVSALPKILEQAKEMEKQQIIDAYNEADTFPQSYLHAENYYSEIFKK